MKKRNGFMSEISPGELIVALGRAWVSSHEALPWNDIYSQLRYAVYCPEYGSEIFICQFRLFGANWWHEGRQTGIGGVTHWRLAKPGEQDFRATKRQLPGGSSKKVNAEAFDTLQRWWTWYCERYGVEL